MYLNLEAAKEAIRQLTLPERNRFNFGYSSEMHELYGINDSVLRCDRQAYDLKCAVLEEKDCVVLQISLPFSYEEDRQDYVSGYLDCIDKSKKVKSKFDPYDFNFDDLDDDNYMIDFDQYVFVHRYLDYKARILTVDDLEQTLAGLIVDAELYYPVIRAVGLGTPVPEDIGELPWIVQYIFQNPLLAPKEFPCDTKEPSRLYFEEYVISQAFAEAEEKRLHPKTDSDTAKAGQKQESTKSSDPEEDEDFRRIMSIFNDDHPAAAKDQTEKSPTKPESAEEEHIIELGEENLNFCGTMLNKNKHLRFDDPVFREKFFRMMFDED